MPHSRIASPANATSHAFRLLLSFQLQCHSITQESQRVLPFSAFSSSKAKTLQSSRANIPASRALRVERSKLTAPVPVVKHSPLAGRTAHTTYALRSLRIYESRDRMWGFHSRLCLCTHVRTTTKSLVKARIQASQPFYLQLISLILRTDAACLRTALALCLPPFLLNATALYPEVTTAEERVVHPRAMAT